jgi:hypothetical protein
MKKLNKEQKEKALKWAINITLNVGTVVFMVWLRS